MPEHRASHCCHAPRQDFRRVRRRCHQRPDHGRLRRSRGDLIIEMHGDLNMNDSAKPSTSTRAGRFGDGFDLGKILLEGRAFFALIVIIIVFSSLSPYYFALGNFLTMASHVAIYGILAIGMSGVVAGFLLQGVTLNLFGVVLYPAVWVVAVLCCLLGAFIGLINGVLIARFKVPAFVATLGVMYVVRGLALLMTNGLTYNNLGGHADLGNVGFNGLGFDRLFNVPVGVLILAVIGLLGSIMLSRTAFGRWLYASGGNERAAQLSGVPVKRVQISVYMLSGVCAAIAGLILSSQLTSAGPTAGTTYELTAIAAVVIGGASLMGGTGNIRGTLLGAFVIGFLSDGLVIIGISSYWQTVFTGAVIVLAVLLNAIQYRRRVKRPAPTAGQPTSPQGGKA